MVLSSTMKGLLTYIVNLCCIHTQAQSMLHYIGLVEHSGNIQVPRILQYTKIEE